MDKLNTVFLGVIAAVALGAALIWWSQQPSAEEQRRAESEQRMQELRESVDAYRDANERLRAVSD